MFSEHDYFLSRNSSVGITIIVSINEIITSAKPNRNRVSTFFPYRVTTPRLTTGEAGAARWAKTPRPDDDEVPGSTPESANGFIRSTEPSGAIVRIKPFYRITDKK